MSAVKDLEREVQSVPGRAMSLVITDNHTYVEAGEILKAIKALRAQVDETFDPIIKKAFESHREAIAQKKKIEAPLVEAESIVKTRIAIFVAEQEQLRRKEELRLQRIAKEEAEKRQVEEAAMLDEIGETEAANAMLEEEPYVAPIIAPALPRVAGISVREIWSAQIMDLMVLIIAVAEGKAPIQCLQPNQIFLNQQARSLRGAMNWPGVRAVSNSNVTAGRK